MRDHKKINKYTLKRNSILIFLFSIILCLFIPYGSNTSTILNNQNFQNNTSDFNLHTKSDITPPPLHWSRSWGTSLNIEEAMNVATDQYNNSYVVGSMYDIIDYYHYDIDIFILKYDNEGNRIWERRWNGSGFDYGLDVCFDVNNNKLYVAGYTNSSGAGDNDALLIRYDENGVQEWNTTWGYSSTELGEGVIVDNNGYIYVSGRTNSTEAGGKGNYDAFIIKFNQSGQQEWNRTWGYVNDDTAYEIGLDGYNNSYIVGQTINNSGYLHNNYSHSFIVKYNSTGHQQWNSTFSGGRFDLYHDLVVDSNNNSYVVGQTMDSTDPYYYRASLTKFNETGGLNWTRTIYGYWSQMQCIGYSAAMDSNGSIYMSGTGLGNGEIFVAKYNSTGDRLWNFTAVGGYGYEVGALAINSNDDLILVGGVKLQTYYLDALILRYSYDPFPPWSNAPSDSSHIANSTGNTIDWYLYDEVGSGYYRVWRNGTLIVNWTSWSNNSIIQVNINTNLGLGTWNYTIEFNNSNDLFSSDIVLVTITLGSTTPTPPIPGFEFLFIAMALSVMMILYYFRKNKQKEI